MIILFWLVAIICWLGTGYIGTRIFIKMDGMRPGTGWIVMPLGLFAWITGLMSTAGDCKKDRWRLWREAHFIYTDYELGRGISRRFFQVDK